MERGSPPERTAEGFPSIPRRYHDVGTQAGALYAAVGVLAAVLRARATGVGTWLDIAQADAAVAFNAGRVDELLGGAEVPNTGGGMAESVRYQYYDTADGRTILFQASERHFFEKFCRALGREDLLADDVGEEFGEHARGDVGLRRELQAIFATRTQAEWVRFFIEHDVPGGPVHRPSELADDPQFRARFGAQGTAPGAPRLVGSPIHSLEPNPQLRPAPTLGEHTDAVLREVLGYEEERIAALRHEGAIA